MIDEKKIEEASAYYAEENAIQVEDQWGDMITDTEELSEAYKEGAHWAINEFLKNLWHSVEEEPKLGKRVLVKINGNLSLFNSGFVVEHLRNYDDCYGIESWLYIDDLFTKKGGEQ